MDMPIRDLDDSTLRAGENAIDHAIEELRAAIRDLDDQAATLRATLQTRYCEQKEYVLERVRRNREKARK